MCPLCLTPQSQKINAQASVSHVEGSTEHLIWIEFPASEWTKGTKNASRGWRGTQEKKVALILLSLCKENLWKRLLHIHQERKTQRNLQSFVFFHPLSWMQASLPLTRRGRGRGDSPFSQQQRRRKLPSEFMQGARREGVEGERFTSSCSITPDVILLIMQIKCRNSSQGALSNLAILKAQLHTTRAS